MNDTTSARHEFRVFDIGLDWVEQAVRRRAEPAGYRESQDLYLLLPDRQDLNLKLRGGELELKCLLDERDGLQQWRPAFKLALALRAAELRTRLAEHGVDGPSGEGNWNAAELVERLRAPPLRAARAGVFKRRLAFEVGPCSVEIDHLRVNGAALDSAAIESEDPGAVQELLRGLGLAGRRNLSYVAALQRILGLAPWDDAATWS